MTILFFKMPSKGSARYLVGKERRGAVVLDGRRPLGWDAHFHVAESFPGRVQQHVAEETNERS